VSLVIDQDADAGRQASLRGRGTDSGSTDPLSGLATADDASLDALLDDAAWVDAVAAELVSRAGALVWSGVPVHLVVRVSSTTRRSAATVAFLVGERVRPAPAIEANPAGVGVEIGVRDLMALLAGEADGALLHLSDRLRIEGDADALLRLGVQVRLPGGERALIDPAALVPEAVSAAIDGVSTEHLDAVMAGPFRQVVLDEVFGRLPGFLREEKAARVRLAVGFEIEGGPTGTDRYVVRVDSGTCVVDPDPTGEVRVDVTLVLTGAQFLRLVLGHLNPVRAVLGGQVKVEGELMKALAFNSVMRIPGI
jgi:putative sterol carrier protein